MAHFYFTKTNNGQNGTFPAESFPIDSARSVDHPFGFNIESIKRAEGPGLKAPVQSLAWNFGADAGSDHLNRQILVTHAKQLHVFLPAGFHTGLTENYIQNYKTQKHEI